MTRQTNRRQFLAGASALVAAPAILRATRVYAETPTLKIGYVSPATGPLAGFGEADDYIIEGINKALAGGIENNGKTWMIEIIKRDSQSNPNRAAEVASQLILEEEVDILTGAATPDTTNPVADQAELNGTPCITTDCPWQPYFFGRGGNPEKPFEWTYHFFWGLEDVIANFTALWDQAGVAKTVGGLFPNDADGNAWGDPKVGFPGPLAEKGFKLIDPGRYEPLNNDFSAYINAFKEGGAEIVTGVMIPPDFGTFWAQAGQQGFKPKVVTIGKALLFPSAVEGLGDRGVGLTSEIWWSPNHPFKSSITGESCKQLADGYTAATGKPWTQPIGFRHALFEVVADVVKRCADVEDPAALVEAIKTTSLPTMVGKIDWATGPVPNVSKTPLVAGQWQKPADKLELVITTNPQAPDIPVGGQLQLLS
ncbi:ABC transporter substrate-binding protein [Tabrizicola sp. J26]|uniref:ABC transporter substrate-binding protein n=1 Tax=Alitabrizicola rongguiensis TaxID=2909234 RepID=UPI001F44BCE9|nr:ABC transporter substrate-binding protein [Tabrizicola rongguiensis]MCF1710300.1 ABC transporter substrate-binding protein [Tabrizicola rongguiensis]